MAGPEPDLKNKVYPVLLAGGTGSRLWPVSRELYPKQLVNFTGRHSLVQNTIKRLDPLLAKERVRIVCGQEHFHEIARHMKEIGVQPQGKIICEPCGRNTAPAVLLSVYNILKTEQDAVLCIFPADHVIKDIKDFQDKIISAVNLAEKGYIVTFGIRSGYPETGYGYIEGAKDISSGALTVKRFIEKPDLETAKKYVRAGNFFWNSGMFAFKASVILAEFKAFQPDLVVKMEEITAKGDTPSREEYEQLPDISIDYAIMEKTDKCAVLPSDFGWSDIGSWKSLYDFLPKDSDNNVVDGDVITKDTRNCFIMGRQRLIATNNLNNMVVVDTPDSVFVSDIENSRDVKSIVAELKERGRKELHQHLKEYYPWGSITKLDQGKEYGVDRLAIYPACMFEIKNEFHLKKHLILVKGEAKITVDGRDRLLKTGESALVSGDGCMKLENTGDEPLCIIQTVIKQTV